MTLILVSRDGPIGRLPRGAAAAERVIAVTEGRPPPGADETVPDDGPPLTVRAGSAAARATTDYVCLMSSTSHPVGDDWIDRLRSAIDGAALATPLLVHPERPRWRATPDDLLTRELGIDLTTLDGAPVALARHAGRRPDGSAAPQFVDAASAACVLVDRARYVAVGGLPALDDLDAAMVELSTRLRLSGGRLVAVPSAVIVDHRPLRSSDARRHPLDPDGPAWRELVDRTGSLLVRRDGPHAARLSIALTVAAPTPRIARRWGDWHLASSLARALQRLGHLVRVQSAGEVDDTTSRAADVQVVLRGKAPVRRTSGQRHVLWVISHPDTLTMAECDEADLVLVASTRFATDLGRRTATPVVPMLQATDVRRFQPRPPDPAWAHPVAIVANARHVLRPVVADALAAGLTPAIIGRGWSRLVDPRLVVAEQVTNEELATVYSSVGVLLNDHWDDMREHGFVSNRVFDALACGTPLISDAMPDLTALFGTALDLYHEPTDLRALVGAVLGDPKAARRRAVAGREEVVARHTFDHRAAELLAALEAHDLTGPPSPPGR